MSYDQKPTGALTRSPGGGRLMPRSERSWLERTVYCVISGAFAVVTGAIVSLAATGSARITLWSAVTAATALAAGMAHESRLISLCRFSCGRWLRRLAKLSPNS